MARRESPITATGPIAMFATDLRELRAAAGSPSYRELARRAHYAPATLCAAASGRALPSLEVTIAFVRACGGDEQHWERTWRDLAATTSTADRPAAAPEPDPYPDEPPATVRPDTDPDAGPRDTERRDTATVAAEPGAPGPPGGTSDADDRDIGSLNRFRGAKRRPQHRRRLTLSRPNLAWPGSAVASVAALLVLLAIAIIWRDGKDDEPQRTVTADRTGQAAPAPAPPATAPPELVPPTPGTGPPGGTAQPGTTSIGQPPVPVWRAVVGPGCPGTAGTTSEPYSVPKGDGWHARDGGWSSDGCTGAVLYTRTTAENNHWQETFTWTFQRGRSSRCAVEVYIPATASGAAHYDVYGPDPATYPNRIGDRDIDQAAHAGRWASLGTWQVTDTVRIRLTDRPARDGTTYTVTAAAARATCR